MSTLDRIRSHVKTDKMEGRGATVKVASKPSSIIPEGNVFYKSAMIKAAAEINRLQELVDDADLQKRAIKIAHKMVMDGHIGVDEMLVKAAEIQTKNMEVIEEAVKLGSFRPNNSIGAIEAEMTGNSGGDPLTAFLMGS